MAREYQVVDRSAPGYRVHAPISGGPPQPLPVPEQVYLPGMGDGVARPNFAAGLSKPHIRTPVAYQEPKPTVTWYPGASLVDINVPSTRPPPPDRESSPRGKITEWSAASRARLKFFLGTLRRDELQRSLVVTLTYPAEFPAPQDHAVYKGHMHTFNVYLLRKWPLCSGIWKLEFQTRGAAHYHLMLYGLGGEPIEVIRAWVRETWYRIAHNGDKHQGVAGTQVDPIKSVGGAVSYLVKYLSKEDQTMPGNFSGRYWGKINVRCLPVVAPETTELDRSEAFMFRRIARKKMQKDVEASRWKRFLQKENEQYWRIGGRLFWECLKSARHGTPRKKGNDGDYKPHFMGWMFKDGGTIEVDGETYIIPHEYQSHPFPVDLLRRDIRQLPRRWKARNNDRVRIMCDASDFVDAMKRLRHPASSFLAWSGGGN